jgi:hypothetical protein
LPGSSRSALPPLQFVNQAPAVAVLVEQHQQDLKDDRLQGKQITGIAGHRDNTTHILILDAR